MLDTAYNAKEVEHKLYNAWESNNLFKANPSSNKEPYTVMMPPPNVTGNLHAGHALCMTLQDILIRKARMDGKDALWQPGTDHASIATERIVTMQLAKKGINKKEIGREAFIEKVWEWKEECGSEIVGQLKRLGASADWSRERFTMDEGCSNAVNKVFVDFYNKGLIYRGTRLVNWDPRVQTSVSDAEVRHVEMQGHIWHFDYPLTDGSGSLTVATTRPETMIGDTAVAVNPNDDRYKHLIGKTVTLPIVNREIKIIADDYVDVDFGTGCVKITPAHDFNDYEIGQRHNLEMINVLNKDATMNENCPEKYRGMDRFDARKEIVNDFKTLGLLNKIEDHVNNVAHAERDDTIIEPYLTTQWYLNVQKMAVKATDAVRNGDMEFIPKNWEKTYFHWLDNVQDWCISRQLWWGHQIPAWHNTNGEIYVGHDAPDGEGWTRDPDTLDTWFSSGLWPFSTLGWPEKTPELDKYYATDVLVTGFDIIFFWVARMMMFGLEITGEVPFKKVFMHALVRDEHGQKMSKSKGNVIDPLELIDAYGADSLRYTIASLTAPGADISLSAARVEGGRNFCTKLWNAAKYAMMNEVTFDKNFDPKAAQHPVNRWALAQLADLVDTQNKAYDKFFFNEIGQSIYHFAWDTYCGWYLELSKPILWGEDESLKTETRQTMGYVLEKLLRIMQPVMPFITEEIWQSLTKNTDNSAFLMSQSWPETGVLPRDEKALADINWLTNVITTLRTARSESNVPNKADVTAFIRDASEMDIERFKNLEAFIKGLTRVNGFTARTEPAGKTDVVAVAEGLEIILPLEGVVDFAAEKERVAKEITKFEEELKKINGMLGNENFVKRAPEHVVAEQNDRKNAILADLSKLQAVLEAR